MKEKKHTQTQQVIETLRQQGGYATLGNLEHSGTDPLCYKDVDQTNLLLYDLEADFKLNF